MVFYIRDNIESRIKCVATGDHAYAFRDGLENMIGRYFGSPELWLETEGGLSDFRFNPHLPEVEEFIQSVNNSDPYIRRHGAIGHL
ncbi:BnaC02g26050D [Brassica napus]|uniref:BnaC02g26050D protein n=2 Tax=Brassica napus TaxID=3708 RepID=A0A078H6S2_BRANA|nr:BnaC02g26050D [Brassica napus]